MVSGRHECGAILGILFNGLTRLRPVKTVGTGINVRSSFSQWARTLGEDLLVLSHQ